MNGFLFQAFIYLCAAVIAVPIAKRFGLGSVLGYLIAGIVIGPLVGLVGAETQSIQQFAEFGVVMMLFLVGLELEPNQLWAMRHRLLGLGGLQVVLTALAGLAGGMAVGLGWTEALAMGLVLSSSSTAIVLQTLSEKGLMKSDGGKASFAVLLFQDISVIPTLALLPLLALPALIAAARDQGAAMDHGATLLAGLPSWQVGGITILAVALVVVGGHYLTRPLFRFIASAQLREVFTAAALLLVIGIALLMTVVGLSPALGTFLAGVVLANSEYRHELESDIEPFKGLLLGLFFITVGAGINFTVLLAHWGIVLALTLAVIAVKGAILWLIGSIFRLRGSDRWLFALGLAQAGEFAFVLLSFTVQNGVIAPSVAQILLLVVALSMLLTPLLFILFDRAIQPRLTARQTREADTIDRKGVAVIAGSGRFGQIVNRMLRSNGYETVVLDLSAETVDIMARFGIKAFFGDASRPDLLDAAGLAEARILVVAIDDPERCLTIVKHARMVRPDIHIVARAHDRTHVYELFNAGCNDIIRETFDSAVRAGRSTFEALGHHPYEAERMSQAFVRNDRKTLRRLAEVYNPAIPVLENEAYIRVAREARHEEETMMNVSQSPAKGAIHKAWMQGDTSEQISD